MAYLQCTLLTVGLQNSGFLSPGDAARPVLLPVVNADEVPIVPVPVRGPTPVPYEFR
jgi:hypothetical protein